MKFYFHRYAEQELDQAVQYYEDCRDGLGIEFAEDVYATIERIIKYPDAWEQISRNTRRCLTNRFPYGIIYQVKNNALRIVAVANLHRKPFYWKERV